MDISLIIGLNSISFVNVDNLLPNPENTLSKDIKFQGAVVDPNDCQKFLTDESIPNQIKTNYIVTGGDTLVVTLTDCLGVKTNLPISLAANFTDEIDGAITAFYQFSVVGQSKGIYSIEIKGVFDGNIKYKQSESFELVEPVTEFRRVSDDSFSYKTIPNFYKIIARSIENQQYNYWAGDFEVIAWVEGVVGKPQSGGEVDVYDNLGNLDKLENIDQHIYELKTVDLPQYFLNKIQSLFGLDLVNVNDKEYVTTEKGENEYFGNYTSGVLTINLTQAFVEGINSSDQGFIFPNDTDMALVKPLQVLNANGADELTVTAGFSIVQINAKLITGTSIFIKLGSTPGGDEIMEEWELTTDDPFITDNNGFMGDFDNSWKIYWSLTGVGSSGSIAISTLAAKQQ